MRWLIALVLTAQVAWGQLSFVADNEQCIDVSGIIDDVISDNTGTVLVHVQIDPSRAGATRRLWALSDSTANVANINLSLLPDDRVGAFAVGSKYVNNTVWSIATSSFLSEGDHLIALLHNGAEPSIWIDGDSVAISYSVDVDRTVWVSKSDSAVSGNFNNSHIGARFVGGTMTGWGNNVVSLVAYYSDALTASQLGMMYMFPGVFLFRASLKAYYDFNEFTYAHPDSAPAAYLINGIIDRSGNGNHGTPYNNPTYVGGRVRVRRRR